MLKMGLPQAARALVDRSLKPVGALNDDVAHAAHWELLFPWWQAYPNNGSFFFGGYLNSPDFG